MAREPIQTAYQISDGASQRTYRGRLCSVLVGHDQLICRRLLTPLFALESSIVDDQPSLVAVPYTLRCFIPPLSREAISSGDDSISQCVNFSDDRGRVTVVKYNTDGSDTDADEADSRKTSSDSDTAYSSDVDTSPNLLWSSRTINKESQNKQGLSIMSMATSDSPLHNVCEGSMRFTVKLPGRDDRRALESHQSSASLDFRIHGEAPPINFLQTFIPHAPEFEQNNHSIRLPGMSSRLLLKHVVLVEEVPAFLEEEELPARVCPIDQAHQFSHSLWPAFGDTHNATTGPLSSSQCYSHKSSMSLGYTADTSFVQYGCSDVYSPLESYSYQTAFTSHPVNDPALVSLPDGYIARGMSDPPLQSTYLPSDSPQATSPEFAFVFENSNKVSLPEPSEAAASLLAILNGTTQDTSFSLMIPALPAEFDRISSIDDPPVARPTPIGAKTSLRQRASNLPLSSSDEDHVPRWPPVLSDLAQ